MKIILNIAIVLFSLTYYGCSEDELSTEELKSRIVGLNSEIDQLSELSTGESSADCRTKYIAGGNGCGPILVYGILGIDTLQIEELFIKLSEAQTALYNLEGGPVCDLGFPAKDSLINGKCLACYGNLEAFECF
jgi:hypothetical protein